MEISLDELKLKYSGMSNEELEHVATQNARGLRPEVFSIIEAELKKRQLSLDMLDGARAQNKEYTINQIKQYASYLQGLPCPVCGNSMEKLNATLSYTVRSFIFFTLSRKTMTIACPHCLDKKHDKAILSTVFLGWWGIPWGVLRTPLYIYRNVRAKRHNRDESPTEILLSYTLDNIGRIEAYKNDREKMKQIIVPDKF